ncbi:MJ0042-type zinc finger domain-containing protein [Caulobacter segnis]|uniref:MJ0042-type zinc finger domain-containing protein n=1 Tax=Caulobacter segnis TaxID=88688 RepID=UPI001CC16EDF|nr:MJ0042-type zinc finger domain-containing protein [Caulobacter segnis]UAL09015.1 zinc-ribbon domain-containing protein [Caulobacter segnis]
MGSVRFAAMILTCPECASRYFVDDSKVGAAGRVVRCASCGHRWTARNEEAGDLFEAPEASSLAGQPGGAEQDPEAAAAAAAGDAETEEPPVSALPGEELPKVFRARANAERRLREATTTGVIWAGMAAAMAVVVVAALIFRIDVVRILPGAAGAYAAVGLPVNTVGLVIDRDSIKAQPSMQDGHAVVTVTGTIRNITEHEVTAPPLRVELLNKDEKRVAGQLAGAANAKIPPGEVRHFSITFLNPPRTAKDLQIGFATEPGAAKAVKTALKKPDEHGAEPELSLRGAQDAPVEHEAAGQEPPGHESGDATSPPTSHEPAHHE